MLHIHSHSPSEEKPLKAASFNEQPAVLEANSSTLRSATHISHCDGSDTDDANTSIKNSPLAGENTYSNDQAATSSDSYLILNDNPFIKCGISWDFMGQPTDLDLSIVVFDKYSIEIDCAYYNKPKILSNAIIHSGDNRDGLIKGDDESISIKLDKIEKNITALYFIVNVHSKNKDFNNVETGLFSLYNSKNIPIYQYRLC